MSMQPLSQTKSPARLDSESTNLMWLGWGGRRNAKDRPVIFKKDASSRKVMTADEGPGSDPAPHVHERLSKQIEFNLTLADCVAFAYVAASVAFYPATVWFLLS